MNEQIKTALLGLLLILGVLGLVGCKKATTEQKTALASAKKSAGDIVTQWAGLAGNLRAEAAPNEPKVQQYIYDHGKYLESAVGSLGNWLDVAQTEKLSNEAVQRLIDKAARAQSVAEGFDQMRHYMDSKDGTDLKPKFDLYSANLHELAKALNTLKDSLQPPAAPATGPPAK
jgi:hypothetical protein